MTERNLAVSKIVSSTLKTLGVSGRSLKHGPFDLCIKESAGNLFDRTSKKLSRRADFGQAEELPNDVERALEYGVNRHTVRYAIRALEQEGLLRVEQGRGTFVVEHSTAYLLSSQTRLTDNLISRGRLARRKILTTATIPADERLAGYLDLQARDDVLGIDTLSDQDEIPIVIAHSYFRRNALADCWTNSLAPTRSQQLSGVSELTTLATMGDDQYASALRPGGAPA
ncbi:DNA-binding transcriptional MocR family regulator [Bradyrhizobium yuanmingense]|uniref:GntR family transcriptional regulator n=1 Tax=Bradyrhizobium yuanmingense TaxID=108015 RepID=UPI003514233E